MELPAGYTTRPATPDDVRACYDLVIALDIAEYGEPDYDESDVREDWSRERFDLARDSWLVHAPDGRLMGYADAWDKRPHELVMADVFVHPDGPDLYPWLFDRVHEWLEPHVAAAGRTVVHAFNTEPNLRRAAALRDRGYDVCRVFRRMVLDPDVPVAAPAPGPGVVIRQATPDDLRTCWSVQGESFAEHFDFSPESYETWLARQTGSDSYRPQYWWLAEVDGVPAGVLIGQQHEESGWVKSLGTLPWARGRGVGTALLLTAFAAFRADGLPKVGLGVDSDNSTGAMALYERLGMRADQRYDCYERVFTRS